MAEPGVRAVPPDVLVADDDAHAREALRDALTRIVDAVVLADAAGRVVWANRGAQALTGHDEAALLELRLDDLVTPVPEMPAEGPPGGPEGGFFAAELVRRDGGRLPVEASIAPARLGGRVAGRLIVARDVTERQRAEEDERRAEALRAVGLLAAGTAHEINNPLAVIHGRIELLAREELSDRARQHLEPVLAAVQRVADVVTRLGHLTRIETNPAMPGTPMLDIRRSSEDAAEP